MLRALSISFFSILSPEKYDHLIIDATLTSMSETKVLFY